MTPQKFILPWLLKIAKMVWDAAALWWEERAVPWLRTSFREGMIPASSLSYLSKSIHPLSVQLNQFGWWFMKEWKAMASVCKILRSPSIVWVCFQVKLQRNKYIDPQTGYIQASVQRVVISPPELGWVPHYGYCSLFPMLMHLLPLVMNWPFFIQVMIGSIFLSFFLSFFLKVLLCYCCLFTPGEKKGCPQLWFVSDVKRMDLGVCVGRTHQLLEVSWIFFGMRLICGQVLDYDLSQHQGRRIMECLLYSPTAFYNLLWRYMICDTIFFLALALSA